MQLLHYAPYKTWQVLQAKGVTTAKQPWTHYRLTQLWSLDKDQSWKSGLDPT